MSFIDGQLADFRGGRQGAFGDKQRYVPGAASQTVRYTLAAGAMTPAAAVVLTIAAGTVDQIGVLSGTNTWTPRDPTARYLVTVHLQTTTGNATTLIAALETNTGTVIKCSGQAGTTGAMHLVLTGDDIDFTTALNIQVIALSAGVLGLIGGGAATDGNFVQIAKLSVQ